MLSFKQISQVARNFAVEIPIEILHFFIVPIALLACDEKSENLPKWASWSDDPDYGINGDDGWRNEHYPNGKNRTYWARLCWLYRNRIGVFSAKYLGVKSRGHRRKQRARDRRYASDLQQRAKEYRVSRNLQAKRRTRAFRLLSRDQIRQIKMVLPNLPRLEINGRHRYARRQQSRVYGRK